MGQTLPKSTILRGYQTFNKVIHNGVCIPGTLLTCYVDRLEAAGRKEKGVALIGFSVPKKKIPLAVNRNRVRRLMREAVRKNIFPLRQKIAENDRSVRIVLMFKGEKTTDIKKLTLHDIEPEWQQLQQKIETLI